MSIEGSRKLKMGQSNKEMEFAERRSLNFIIIMDDYNKSGKF